MEKTEKITLSHGAGGRLMHSIIRDIFVSKFDNDILNSLSDSAILKFPPESKEIAFTTDSYTVTPLFFPGADIGKLAVCGTVNDLAVCGAVPLYLSIGMIVEEGCEIGLLDKIAGSIAGAAKEAGVSIVTGDFKVVERGKGDKIYINSSGIGIKPVQPDIGSHRIKAGDDIIINGAVGDHELSVLAARNEFKVTTNIQSDCAPLNLLIKSITDSSKGVRLMRDPTRGGIATTLNEIAMDTGLGVILDEALVPVNDEVLALCEILGFDWLYLANEGKVVVVCDHSEADKIIDIMRRHKYGKQAQVIGRVAQEPAGSVILKTAVGSSRVLDMLSGSQLPRIC